MAHILYWKNPTVHNQTKNVKKGYVNTTTPQAV